MNAPDTLQIVRDQLVSHPWDAYTCTAIAQALRSAGYTIDEVAPEELPVTDENIGAERIIEAQRIEQVRREWVAIAGGEPVVVEYIKGTFYGICSELAAYRIERKYNCRPKVEARFSPVHGWFVRLETMFGASGRLDADAKPPRGTTTG